jgi:hypothetical protein
MEVTMMEFSKRYEKKVNAALKKIGAPPVTTPQDRNVLTVCEYGPWQPHMAAEKIVSWRERRP